MILDCTKEFFYYKSDFSWVLTFIWCSANVLIRVNNYDYLFCNHYGHWKTLKTQILAPAVCHKAFFVMVAAEKITLKFQTLNDWSCAHQLEAIKLLLSLFRDAASNWTWQQNATFFFFIILYFSLQLFHNYDILSGGFSGITVHFPVYTLSLAINDPLQTISFTRPDYVAWKL